MLSLPTDVANDLDTVAAAAAAAAPVYAALPLRARAAALVAVASRLEENADELVALAASETGLTEVRLRGELKRTCVQLRLFAETVVDGAYLDVRLDDADPAFALGARPDLRRVLEPVGPVLNFAASNFPFAFSIAGGDSAAALAAGCPVIVKAHSGHPQLSNRTAELVAEALSDAEMPAGTFQTISGQKAGVALLQDERVRAGSFTGSYHAGTLLARVAADRQTPIPFYGELSSVNPVFVTQAALAESADAIAQGYWTSVSGSAGQLCTKPGFVFAPRHAALREAIAAQAGDAAEHRLLTTSISIGYETRRTDVLTADGIDVLVKGSLRWEGDFAWVRPTIVAVGIRELFSLGERLLDEAFGPLSVLVEIDEDTDLADVVRSLFPGNLTGSVFIADGEVTDALRALVRALADTSGRVLFNSWPTGVAVTPAMQHGGPWPATTRDATSVGTAAIGRFLRGVAYQNAPDAYLPEPLQRSNPWSVPVTRAPAGESTTWGAAVRS